jgi:hypothetical protein
MENPKMSKDSTQEVFEQQNINPEHNKENKNSTQEDESLRVSKIKTEISKKEQDIKETENKINKIRDSLGLPPNDEIPPSIQQQKDLIEKLKNSIEYFNEIPIEKGKYYRVTGISEILSIIKNKSLVSPENSFYDRQMLRLISEKSDYSTEELELINANDPLKIREIYNKYILNPNKEKGIVALVPRTKSNHGDIGFVKEGFFYNPTNKEGGHFGAPVIVGSEEVSVFEQGAHGSRTNLFNKDIEPNKPVVLKDGIDAKNFEYWLHDKDKGWCKKTFEDLSKDMQGESSYL